MTELPDPLGFGAEPDPAGVAWTAGHVVSKRSEFLYTNLDRTVSQPGSARRRQAQKRTSQLPLHDATEAYLGYAYQADYALFVLLGASDGDAVSIESADDVVLSGAEQTLHQLKHSRGTTPRPVSVNDDRWWRSLAIWIPQYLEDPGNYILVSSAPLPLGDPLASLAGTGDRAPLVRALEDVVARVRRERDRAAARGASLPHQRRAAGVDAFAAMSRAKRRDFLDRVHFRANVGDITAIPTSVAHHLSNVVVLEARDQIARRLLEWWDRRVLDGILGRLPRTIPKSELQQQLSSLIASHRSNALPDDFGSVNPPEEELLWESRLVEQMNLVNAGEPRVVRGLHAHWRATRQRARWLEDDISVGVQLTAYDERLFRAWRDRHGPMKSDCANVSEEQKKLQGRQLLDWSHHDAHREVRPVRPEAPTDFLAQGTLQSLANDGKIGWHPDYAKVSRRQRRGRAS